MEDLIVKTHKLSKSFFGVRALNNIDLEIKRGEIHALVGENGAGKSTLIKILVGVYKKDSGEIYLDGQRREFNSPTEAFHNGISIIYQETSLIPQLTILQNIFLGMEYTNLPGIINEQKIRKHYDNICQKMGFNLDPHVQVRNLGVAEQKLVEILKALVHNSKFIIMDEPTDSLTGNELEHLLKIILELKAHHVTVLYITHNLEEVFRITDRITVLRDGERITTVATQIVSRNELVKAMLGESLKEITLVKSSKKRSPRVLKIENLTRKGVLNNINFEAYEGEVLAITGLIGAGKTELARAIFGADKRDAGNIFINETLIRIASPIDAVKNGICLIPEDRKEDGLVMGLDLYKNITLPGLERFAKNGVLSRKKEIEASTRLINKLDIRASDYFQPVKYLSGGNQQKTVIAKWLEMKPKVLIMDEPTRGIDIKAKAEVFRITMELANSGVCIIFITSEVKEALQMADRILILGKGRLTAEFSHTVKLEKVMEAIIQSNPRKGDFS
ncbi:MAG: sugar ABC transporter ATP-binding protein [Spirochaetota bacterium]